MKKTFAIDTEKLRRLIDAIPSLEGIKGGITLTVSIEDLAKLKEPQLKSFLEAVNAIVQIQSAA